MNEKIISILKTFTEDDVKDFKKFIASPYFSRGRNFEKYYNSLLKFYPEFEIEKDKFLRSYFGKKDDAAGKHSKILRTLNSEFAKILDDYITVNSLKNIKFYSKYLLLEGYTARGLFELGEVKAVEALSEKENLDVGFIKDMQLILLKNLLGNFKGLANKNYEIYDNTESQSEDFINFFFGCASHFLNSFEVNAKIFKIEKNTEQLSLLLDNFDFERFIEKLNPDFPNYKKIKLDIALIGIILNSKNFDNFYTKLNELYMDAYDSLDMRDKMNYFTSVLNYYTSRQSEALVKLKFEFIKFALSKKLFPSGEIRYLNILTFKIFMIAAIHAGDLVWTEEYVNEYAEKLNPDFKDNMLIYANAYLSHYKEDYLNSLNYITDFKFDNEILTYDMKLMQLKNYYELAKQSESYIENLNYSIDAFSHFLKDNKKVSESYRMIGREFVAIIRLLIKLKFGTSKKDKEEIKFNLESFRRETKNIWLKDKIKEVL